MSILPHRVFITGGGGTLGKAIIERSKLHNWDTQFTIYSRDAHKHDALNRLYPQVKCIIGDIRDTDRLSDLMVGHDLVIHAAAIKHIPNAENNALETIDINVIGSVSVGSAAINAGVPQVVGISTDKTCYAVNVYGSCKYLMEKSFQEMARDSQTKFNLVRYGNVLGSVGSVIQVWRKMLEETGKVRATDPDMTRFWITSQEAVSLILTSLEQPSGTITIPRLPATTMKELATYVLPSGTEVEYMGLRAGEKRHEMMLTREEGFFAVDIGNPYILLFPTTGTPNKEPLPPLVSNEPLYWMSREELLEKIGEL